MVASCNKWNSKHGRNPKLTRRLIREANRDLTTNLPKTRAELYQEYLDTVASLERGRKTNRNQPRSKVLGSISTLINKAMVVLGIRSNGK